MDASCLEEKYVNINTIGSNSIQSFDQHVIYNFTDVSQTIVTGKLCFINKITLKTNFQLEILKKFTYQTRCLFISIDRLLSCDFSRAVVVSCAQCSAFQCLLELSSFWIKLQFLTFYRTCLVYNKTTVPLSVGE